MSIVIDDDDDDIICMSDDSRIHSEYPDDKRLIEFVQKELDDKYSDIVSEEGLWHDNDSH